MSTFEVHNIVVADPSRSIACITSEYVLFPLDPGPRNYAAIVVSGQVEIDLLSGTLPL